MDTIRIELHPMDLIRLNIRRLPRQKALWIIWIMVGLFIFVLHISEKGIQATIWEWLALAIVEVFIAVAGIAGGALTLILSILLLPRRHDGVLGEHIFHFSDEGLHEHTQVNDTLYKWDAVMALRKTEAYIEVEVGTSQFHALPRRDFETDKDYEACWETLKKYVQQSRLERDASSSSRADKQCKIIER